MKYICCFLREQKIAWLQERNILIYRLSNIGYFEPLFPYVIIIKISKKGKNGNYCSEGQMEVIINYSI